MGYIYYARGGVAQDPNVAIDEYQRLRFGPKWRAIIWGR